MFKHFYRRVITIITFIFCSLRPIWCLLICVSEKMVVMLENIGFHVTYLHNYIFKLIVLKTSCILFLYMYLLVIIIHGHLNYAIIFKANGLQLITMSLLDICSSDDAVIWNLQYTYTNSLFITAILTLFCVSRERCHKSLARDLKSAASVVADIAMEYI